MNRFLDQTLHKVAREGARKLLLPLLLGLSAALIMLVGIGFLLASAFITLAAAWGPAMAALALGLGLMVLAAVLVLIAKTQMSRKAVATARTPLTPVAADADRDGAALVAFTAAFVLGRYLTGDGRG